MERRELGGIGPRVSTIGLGTLHFGVYLDQKSSVEILHQALDAGVNFFDTAPIYGHGQSESIVGEGIQRRRSEVVLATKAGLQAVTRSDGSFGVEGVSLTRDYLRQSVESSLSALRTDYLDLLQLHAFDLETPPEETFDTLADLVQEGKIRYVGASNYNPAELTRILDVVRQSEHEFFVSVQTHYNLIERRAEASLIPKCQSHGLGVICNRALCRGILSGKYRMGQKPPEGSRAHQSWRVERWLTAEILSLVDALSAYAIEQNRSPAELALAWAAGAAGVTTALVGVRNPNQLAACLWATSRPILRQELADIETIVESTGDRDMVYRLPETFFEK